MQLSFMEIETLIGYVAELTERDDTAEQDHYTLAHVYSKLVGYYTEKTLALTGATLTSTNN